MEGAMALLVRSTLLLSAPFVGGVSHGGVVYVQLNLFPFIRQHGTFSSWVDMPGIWSMWELHVVV
jgi:hypothetical protein